MRRTRIIKKQNNKEKDCEKTTGRKFILFVSIVLLIVVIGLVLYKMSHQTKRQSGINEEISNLQSQINLLEGENQDLNELISYLKTDDFKEKEAKDKLNLIKEGEQMVLVKENLASFEEKRVPQDRATTLIVRRESYYYWWHYFFSIK